jgi:Sulfotransferase family
VPFSRRSKTFESRLVWIFGSPRSGSTWLLELLVHPLTLQHGWRDEGLGVGRRDGPHLGESEAVPVNEPYIPQHLTPPLFGGESISSDFVAVTLNSFRRTQAHYFLADQYEDVWRPQLRALVLARLEAQARRISEAFSLSNPWVVIKEPNGSAGADFVLSLLPESRLLFLLRDGRDVVDSMIDAQAPGAWLERAWEDRRGEPAQRRLEQVRRESLLWLARTRAVERAYEAHPPELRHLVRYEELLEDPSRGLADLDRWLGLRRDAAGRREALKWNDFEAVPAEARGPGKPLRAASPGLWRDNLTDAEQRVMDEVMGEKLAQLGYT